MAMPPPAPAMTWFFDRAALVSHPLVKFHLLRCPACAMLLIGGSPRCCFDAVAGRVIRARRNQRGHRSSSRVRRVYSSKVCCERHGGVIATVTLDVVVLSGIRLLTADVRSKQFSREVRRLSEAARRKCAIAPSRTPPPPLEPQNDAQPAAAQISLRNSRWIMPELIQGAVLPECGRKSALGVRAIGGCGQYFTSAEILGG